MNMDDKFEVDDEETQPSDANSAIAVDEAETEDHLDERDDLSEEVEDDTDSDGEAILDRLAVGVGGEATEAPAIYPSVRPFA
jgi:hypothetical protein